MTTGSSARRGSYDLTMRHLALWFPEDIAYLSLGRKVETVEIVSPDLPAIERRADWLSKVTVEGETFLLQVEFQTEYSEQKVVTMLDYRVRARAVYALPVFSAVVYLTDDRYPGPGKNWFEEIVLGQQQHVFRFHEVRLWELDARRVLGGGLRGLIPLVPLMKGETGSPPLVQSLEAATRVADNEERSNLVAAIAVLAGIRYPADLIHGLIRREAMKESVIYQEILAEGLAEGREEGREEGRREGRREGLVRHILGTLTRRFDGVPLDVEQRISQVADFSHLDELADLAHSCDGLGAFAAGLDTQ